MSINAKSLLSALEELKQIGVTEENLESRAKALPVGEVIMGSLPGGGSWTLSREDEGSYRVIAGTSEK